MEVKANITMFTFYVRNMIASQITYAHFVPEITANTENIKHQLEMFCRDPVSDDFF